ncbi:MULTISPECIES: hypothetical protein [unclassified Marinovum]
MQEQRLQKRMRHYMNHGLVGFAASTVFVTMGLGFNIANLAHLVTSSVLGVVGVAVLWVICGFVFTGVQFGLSMIGTRDDDEGGPGGGLRGPVQEYVPIRVPVSKPRRKL